jgi:hypothetical protein
MAGLAGVKTLSAEQLQALLIGLPWQGLGPSAVITML